MKKWLIISLIIFSAVLALVSRNQRSGAEKASAKAIIRTYTTNFPFTENPISEGGNWMNGSDDGLDWGNAATKPGLGYGLQNGAIHYSDGTAILTGSWGPDQTVQGTVYIGKTNARDYPEVELRLRSSLSAHNCTGYEVQWGVAQSNPYFAIVRWNGKLGNFTILYDKKSSGYWPGSQYTIHNGDVIKATIVGNVITAYINGVPKAQVTDNTFTSGSPGMGFNYYCGGACSSPHDGYGFTSFSATGELSIPSHP